MVEANDLQAVKVTINCKITIPDDTDQ